MKTQITLTSTFLLDTYYYDVVLVAKNIAFRLNTDVEHVSLTPVNLLENVWRVDVSLCTSDVKRDLHILYDSCFEFSTTFFNR